MHAHHIATSSERESPAQLQRVAHRTGRGFTWSEDEDALLRELAPQGAPAAARTLGRSLSSVRCRASTLGLVLGRPYEWSDQDLATLRRLAGLNQIPVIAAYLGRTEPAVQQMAFRHGISLAPRQAARPVRPSPRPWLESEDALLRANAERGSREIAALTGRTASAVKARAIKLAISLAAAKPDDKRPAAPLSHEVPQTPLQRAISFLAGRSITVALLEHDMISIAGGPAVPRRMAIRQANLLGAGIAYPGEAIEL